MLRINLAALEDHGFTVEVDGGELRVDIAAYDRDNLLDMIAILKREVSPLVAEMLAHELSEKMFAHQFAAALTEVQKR